MMCFTKKEAADGATGAMHFGACQRHFGRWRVRRAQDVAFESADDGKEPLIL